MNFLRSKKLEKHLQMMKNWTQSPDKTSLYQFKYNSTVNIASSIWDDIEVEKWFSTLSQLSGPNEFASALIKAPITDTTILSERQQMLFLLKSKKKLILTPELEQTCKWFLATQEFSKNYLYSMLFPNAWYMRWVRWNPTIFTAYHYYHCYFTVVSSLIYPISVIMGPYWFLTNKLNLNISFTAYIGYIVHFIKLLKNQNTSSYSFYKFMLIIVVYVGFYLYSLIQTIDLSIQLHYFRQSLCKKIEDLCQLQKKLQTIYNIYKIPFWKPFEPTITESDLFTSLKPNLTYLHTLLTNPQLQEQVHKLYKIAVIHDTLIILNQRLANYTFVKYGKTTYIGDMKNPMLGPNQISNPIYLHKNLIISGPNAGGKTTYVKSLLWNILLAQSFGIVYGSYGQIKPFDAILHHHRIQDITGDNSLFQAEMRKIKETLICLDTYQNIIYFLDEPLHSTHPVDGASMLKSLLCYFGERTNIKIIVTSHYFSIQDVDPGKYHNLSVKASVLPDKIEFNYKLYQGPSQQTIGIELLRKQDFPEIILTTATKFKNKIYSQPINV